MACVNRASVVPRQIQPLYTLNQWHQNNRYRYQCAETQQELADRLIDGTQRVCELTAETARTNKAETDHRLEEKLSDIEFRKNELLRIRKEVLLEIDSLTTYRNRLSKALASVRKDALVVCEKCLALREERIGVDLVMDNVQKGLLKEIKVIKEAEKLLMQPFAQTQNQLRKLKASLFRMDCDLNDKEANIRIDRHNLEINESYVDLCTYDRECFRISTITLNEWETQTNKSIAEAGKELNTARAMRCHIDTTIKQAINDLVAQKNSTDGEFRYRIEQTKDAKMKLEIQHSKVLRQAAEIAENIENIEKSIADKETYMALARTRFGNRCRRPGLELTQDLVESFLIKEIHDLREIVSQLQSTLCEAQASFRFLLKMQMQLEEDINIKTYTLKIDEVDCMTLRQTLDYHAY